MHYPEAIRDPIHGYVRLTSGELEGLDTPEVQRLRGIAQLGLTERVYPGARHSRFEHVLGALEVSTRIFEELRGRVGTEALLRPLGLSAKISEYEHLLAVARWGALLHDIGHAPFSHVTETLLPGGRSHEDLTGELLEAGRVGAVLRKVGCALFEDVRRVMIPTREPLPLPLDFVHDVISGPVGADRMDYLLRDSAATGVSYGIFDLGRILHTLLPVTVAPRGTPRVRLGIERGGVLAVEGMGWGRVSMFQQVYNHHTRRILDKHLVSFLESVLPGGCYPEDLREYLEWNDARVVEMLRVAATDPGRPGHRDAVRIVERKHHRMLPQELEGEDPTQIEGWLRDWVAAIRVSAPEAEPLYDLIHPVLDPVEDLRVEVVLNDGNRVPLRRLSSLIARLRLPAIGRVYVERSTGAVPCFPPPS